eukprot:CAMPEP_0175983626 /NCGR_PEP_ID=MMETSP0108-20121206/48553_1 /TAXON_ID=195067 ORGANISM="Goniomonas pacifica, Strain CCMP1869" /NCGR_SAMPLE_ID=MMETSP0108 /ASSEMBLY_ACC=CAM_ASM_000204 /LENGTH=57 /DNA_ID=CAMNT_0017314403 /DNA_START=102 /DNA_END=275 /DNA_ORIENTATION=+
MIAKTGSGKAPLSCATHQHRHSADQTAPDDLVSRSRLGQFYLFMSVAFRYWVTGRIA